MYESYFKFRAKPFSLLPDPEFLFLSARHQSGLNRLEYGLLNRAVFTVLTGEPGTGKTTLLNKILDQSRDRFTVGVITTTHPNADSLLPWVADAFGLNCLGQDTVGHFRALTAFLGQSFAAGQQVLLVIDEAQNLNLHMLEDLRLLSNINDGRQHAIQIILAGQPVLRELLTRSDMRQLAQRIAVDCALEPLAEDETTAYVRHRLLVAGGHADIFTAYACSVLHRLSGGTPRVINQLCDLALAYGYGEGADRITSGQVLQVALDRKQGGLLPTVVDPSSILLDAETLERESREWAPASPAQAPDPLHAMPSPLSPPVPPIDPGNLYRQGLDLKQAGSYREALKKFERAEQDHAYRFKAAAQRGLCLRAIGKLDDAALSFRHAMAVNGAKANDILHVRYVLGLTLESLGKSDEAQTLYQEIYHADPQFRDVADRIDLENGATGFPLSLLQSLRRNWQQFRGRSLSSHQPL
jgi:general secretion pathway protein A